MSKMDTKFETPINHDLNESYINLQKEYLNSQRKLREEMNKSSNFSSNSKKNFRTLFKGCFDETKNENKSLKEGKKICDLLKCTRLGIHEVSNILNRLKECYYVKNVIYKYSSMSFQYQLEQFISSLYLLASNESNRIIMDFKINLPDYDHLMEVYELSVADNSLHLDIVEWFEEVLGKSIESKLENLSEVYKDSKVEFIQEYSDLIRELLPILKHLLIKYGKCILAADFGDDFRYSNYLVDHQYIQDFLYDSSDLER